MFFIFFPWNKPRPQWYAWPMAFGSTWRITAIQTKFAQESMIGTYWYVADWYFLYIYIYITHDIYIILYIYIYVYIYVKYLYIEIFIISIYTCVCVCLITILSHVSHWNCHLAFLALKVADDDSFVSVSNALDLTCLVGTCVLIGGGQNQNRKMVVYSSKNGDIMGFHGIFHGDWWLNNNLWWFNGRPVCELKKITISSVNHHVHLQTGHGFHFFSC